MFPASSYKNDFFQVEKHVHTKKMKNDRAVSQSMCVSVCVWKCGVEYYLATHYYGHKKQIN